MTRLHIGLGTLVVCLLQGGCGGEDGGNRKRTQSSENCEVVCNFWANCNNRDLDPGACATHCDDQTSGVSDDCLELYVAQTDCEAQHLDCSDLLGTACEAEYDAYHECEEGQ